MKLSNTHRTECKDILLAFNKAEIKSTLINLNNYRLFKYGKKTYAIRGYDHYEDGEIYALYLSEIK